MSKRNHVMNLCRVALLVAMYVLLGSYKIGRASCRERVLRLV